MIRWLEHLYYEEGLSEEEKVLGRPHSFQYLKGAYKQGWEGLFTRVDSDRTRGNGFKPRQGGLGWMLGGRFSLRR